MKLNKVLALALSGVMAVSMLAGCSNNTDKNEGDQGEVVTNSVAAAVNEDLNDDSKDKISFSDNAKLEQQLADAVALNGIVNLPDADKVQATMNDFTGLSETKYATMKDNTAAKNYETILVRSYNKATFVAAKNELVKEIDAWMNELPYAASGSDKYADEDDLDDADLPEGTTYVKYSYTGNVAMVRATDYDGINANYYFVVTISQTATTAVAE